MLSRTSTLRLAFLAVILCNFIGEAFAQSNVHEIVRSQMTGDEFHIFVDPHALELFGDSVITSLNVDGDETWNTWKDVLSNGNSPGMDVNFDGWNAYGIDSLLVQGAAKLDSTLEVDGYVRMNDSLYVAMYALFQSKLSIEDSLVVAGGTALNSTLDVAGDIAAASALTVTGNTTLNDLADLNDSLDVEKDATFQSTVHIGDSMVVAGGTDLNGTLDVASDIAAASGLTVAGNTTLNDLVDLNDSLNVAMDATFQSTLHAQDSLVVAGGTALSSTLDVDGITSLDSLHVSEGVLFDSNVYISGNTVLIGSSEIDGDTYLDDTDVDGTLDVSGATGVDGNFDVATDKFTVDATNGNTAVGGTLGVAGAATMSSTLGVTGAATLSSTLDVDGDTDLDDTNVDGTLDVSGAIGVDGNFDVATDKFTVDATTGRTEVAGDLIVAESATVEGVFDVMGATTLDNTLLVTDAATVSGDFDVNTDKFTVDASNGNTAVAGTLSVIGTSSSASGSTIGNLTLANGSITDSSGLLSFGDEALSTTGTLASGTQTVTGNVMASGTVQAEQLTSTDDLTVADVANIDGTLELATGSITDQTGEISFGDNNLSTTGDLDISAGTLTLAEGQVGADKVGGGYYPTATYQHTASTLNYATTTMNLKSYASFNTTADVTMDIDGTLDVSDADLGLAAGQVIADKVGAGTFDAGSYSFNGSTISDLGTVTTADIDGGTIDGATISTSDVTVGIGKTLNMTTGSAFNADGGTYMDIDGILNVAGATLTLDAGQVGADKVGAGTFDAGTYSFAGSTISDLGTVTTADIDGGSISGSTLTESNITLGASNTLDASAGAIILAAGQVPADKIGAGTFGAGVYSFVGDLEVDGTINGITVNDGNGTGGANTAVGAEALNNASNYTWYSTAIGHKALYANSSGEANTAVGAYALQSSTSGAYNVAMGTDAMKFNLVGDYNTGIGYKALRTNESGNSNTAIGSQALWTNTSGSNNTAIGETALDNNVSGSKNTAIGDETDVASGNLTNATAIGYGAIVASSNTIQLGDANVTAVKTSGTIEAGLTVPSGKTLDVSAGTLTLANDQISGDAIDGGTIGSITIDQLNLASGAESPATRSTVMGVLVPWATSSYVPATAAPYNTGTYIDLTPGKWQLHINIATDLGHNSYLDANQAVGAGGGSIALGMSANQSSYVAYPSQFHTETLVGGSLDGDAAIYDVIQGQPLIEVTSNVRLYLWVKDIRDRFGNTSTSASVWETPASDAWDLNYLYAVPVNW